MIELFITEPQHLNSSLGDSIKNDFTPFEGRDTRVPHLRRGDHYPLAPTFVGPP